MVQSVVKYFKPTKCVQYVPVSDVEHYLMQCRRNSATKNSIRNGRESRREFGRARLRTSIREARMLAHQHDRQQKKYLVAKYCWKHVHVRWGILRSAKYFVSLQELHLVTNLERKTQQVKLNH